jgi:cytochrome c556
MSNRTVLPVVMVMATIGLGITAIANEKPTAEFQSIMKSNSATNMALKEHVSAKNYDAIAADAATFKANFTKIEAFWTAKKVDDAIALAKTGAKGAADLEMAAKAKNDDGITAATSAIGGTCAGCHKMHREQLPDKTYEIK